MEPRIAHVGRRQFASAEEFGQDLVFRPGMKDLCALPAVAVTSRVIDDDRISITSQITELSQPSEESGCLPILVLAPSLVRMVVALCAVQSSAHEHTDLLGHDVLGWAQVGSRPEVA
jgi:hypothetical protein